MTFQFPQGGEEQDTLFYPNFVAAVNAKSDSIPPKLLERIVAKINADNVKLAKEGKPHAAASFDCLDKMLKNNNLIPIFTEMPLIKKTIGESDEIKMFENAGKLKFILKQGKFECTVEFVIPEDYPGSMVQMKILKHNFDETFAQIFETHCRNIIRRLWNGAEPGYDKKINVNEGKIGQRVAHSKKHEVEMANMQVATAAEIKHDVEYLHKMADLRNNGDGNKADRKFVKLQMKHEVKYEEEKAKQLAEDKYVSENLDKNGQLIKTQALPQIHHAVNFLNNYFVKFLPTAKCGLCGKRLLCKITKGEEDPMFPERAYCGHWVHKGCFEELVSNPPFEGNCPDCGERLISKNFPCDKIQMVNKEKVWRQEQEKKGQEDDLDRLFGM